MYPSETVERAVGLHAKWGCPSQVRAILDLAGYDPLPCEATITRWAKKYLPSPGVQGGEVSTTQHDHVTIRIIEVSGADPVAVAAAAAELVDARAQRSASTQ